MKREKNKRERREAVVHIRLSTHEAEMVREQADKLGLNISAYMRMLIWKIYAKPQRAAKGELT